MTALSPNPHAGPSGVPRVVVADDSALMRRIVSAALERSAARVVATVADGDAAVAACERERPDALTLDLTMPGLDGLGVLRSLRERGLGGLPVVVVSAFSARHGARAVDALSEGAFELVPKPAEREGLEQFGDALVAAVLAAAESGRTAQRPTLVSRAGSRRGPARRSAPARALTKAVVIATSTGGPRALAALMPQLPGSLGMGTLIVQHMPPGFTGSLAARLDRAARLHVREAAGDEILDPRTALLAPGGKHLRLSDEGRVMLTEEPEIGGLRPRADLLIEDAARVYRDRLVLVVMTGMGADGLRGAHEVRAAGGRILVEAQATCTVYGMPRAVAEAGLADDELPLDRLAQAIVAEAGL